MVKFLIKRPIAVLMAFTACFIVGLVTYFSLPVSLLPDVDIPQITVQVSAQRLPGHAVGLCLRPHPLRLPALRQHPQRCRGGPSLHFTEAGPQPSLSDLRQRHPSDRR